MGCRFCASTLDGLTRNLRPSEMLDQIYRYYKRRDQETGEMEYTVTQSIYKGWDEVSASILASAATTIVVFIPIAMLGGLIGSVLHAVAVTIILAIFSSFLVAGT